MLTRTAVLSSMLSPAHRIQQRAGVAVALGAGACGLTCAGATADATAALGVPFRSKMRAVREQLQPVRHGEGLAAERDLDMEAPLARSVPHGGREARGLRRELLGQRHGAPQEQLQRGIEPAQPTRADISSAAFAHWVIEALRACTTPTSFFWRKAAGSLSEGSGTGRSSDCSGSIHRVWKVWMSEKRRSLRTGAPAVVASSAYRV